MRELVVILPDYDSVAIDGHAAAGAALPRLAILETLLSQATRTALPVGGWRAWLREQWHLPKGSLAGIVALAWGEPRESARHYWLATPVHLFAGLDSVRLHPQGLLRLSGSEQMRLVADFARVFQDSGWQLLSRDRRDLLLAGPALSASGSDPTSLLGAEPTAGLPQGRDAAKLRRLASEIELWLHEHPLNIDRLRRSELPVSALWLWGAQQEVGSSAPAPPGAGQLPLFSGEDTYVEALWELCGGPLEPASAQLPTASSFPERLLLQRVCESPGLVAILSALEQVWLRQACAALRARRLQGIRIVTVEHAHALSGWGLARLWRRRRPWWERL